MESSLNVVKQFREITIEVPPQFLAAPVKTFIISNIALIFKSRRCKELISKTTTRFQKLDSKTGADILVFTCNICFCQWISDYLAK